jgi:hypothetical protein
MLAYKIQMLGNYPEESIQHSEHSKNLKSRISEPVCYEMLVEFTYFMTQDVMV